MSREHGNCRLTNADVRKLRAAYAAGTCQASLAAKWRISEAQTSRIVRGQNRLEAGGMICGQDMRLKGNRVER